MADDEKINWGQEFDRLPKEEEIKDTEKTEEKSVDKKPAESAESEKDSKTEEPEVDDYNPKDYIVKEGEATKNSSIDQQTVSDIAETVKPDEKPKQKSDKRFKRFKVWFKNKWANKRWRAMFIASCLLLVFLLSLLVPVVRYSFLNLVGLRTRAAFTVLDSNNNQPLVGADVSLAGKQTEADANGKVVLTGLKHGKTKLKITHPGFAEINTKKTLGFGTNNFENIKLESQGTRFSLLLKDAFSDTPVENTSVVFGESTALSNEDGIAELVIEPTDKKEIDVLIVTDRHFEKEYKIKTDTSEQQVLELLPNRKHYFISQRDGGFSVYEMLLDGTEQELFIEPTGDEEKDLRLSINPNGKVGALVSTRAGERNSEGFLLENLDIIDLETGELRTIATSERIELLDWSGNRLIFISETAGTSLGNKERNKIRSFNVGDLQAEDIAKSNYFQDAVVADGVVYYIPYDIGKNRIGGVKGINVDGSNKVDIEANKDVYTLYRNSYGGLVYEITYPNSQWVSFSFENRTKENLTGKPANLKERVYQVSPDGKQAAFVEKRDGKGVLIIDDLKADQDAVAVNQSGLQQPLQWIRSDLLVYRVVTDDENADYLLNLNTNETTKLVDVYHAEGIDRYNY